MKRLLFTVAILFSFLTPTWVFGDGVGAGCGTKIVNGQRVNCSCNEMCKP
jgi:hypothetical protein